MPSTYSPDLRIELIANGEQSGTWGATTNNNLGTLIEDAISGVATVSVASANQALTALNGAADQARCATLVLTTLTSAPFAVYVPPVSKLYVVDNTSAHAATVYCSTSIGNTTAAGTGAVIPAGKAVLIRSDGTNVFEQFDHVVGGLSVGGALSTAGTLSVTGTSTLTGAATFGSTVTLNANPVANLQAATKQYVDTAVSNSIPTGGIIMWSGTIATIPSGWALCNGSNGTPDLRDRFIIGASQDSGGAARTNITGSLTQTGGSKDAIVVSHTHTATVTDPGHSHSYIASVIGTPQTGLTGDLYTAPNRTTSTATTGITVSNSTTGSSGTDANLVPYYALAFIMKT